MSLLSEGRRVLRAEARAISEASRNLDTSFEEAITLLKGVRGKIVVTGIGKSGLLGRRIASIFSSTGTPAFFLHPTEGLHGDIGIMTADDAVIFISHSGKSDELLSLVPHVKRHRSKMIAITKTRQSPLSKICDVTLVTGVKKEEACPFNLIPTTSSAVTAAIGDSLAIALLRVKGFKKSDYQNVHPGGAIGKRLLFRVEDLMTTDPKIPRVKETASLDEAVSVITKKALGMVCIIGKKNRLAGILTDGDLRRLVERKKADLSAAVSKMMVKNPKTCQRNVLAVEALSLMEKHAITSLAVVDTPKDKRVVGVIHMHSILKAGVV